MPLKLQQGESSKYNRVFVNFGSFHVKMAFFHAIGKYIELFGGPNILSISSTHFKSSGTRCKRIHTILYAPMEILHFEEFLMLSTPIQPS